jgi:hypothetical protein
LATKCSPDGKKLKLRARLVANGQRQQYGVDYFDTFAPMANMVTICITMAAQQDWEIHQVDIKSTYLYASIQEEIYMRAPPGYLKDGEKGKVLRLRRSLPGLKQAGFEWAKELAGVFQQLEFSWSKVDQAIFFRHTKDEHMVVTISFDNMAITANHISHIKRCKSQLHQHFDLCYHFIRSHIKDRLFKLYYCPTDNNVADTFTKPLPHPHLQKLRTQMSLAQACTQGGVLGSDLPKMRKTDRSNLGTE